MAIAERIKNALTPGSDIVDMLKDEHREVEALFKEFESSDDNRTRVALVKNICDALTTHAKVEEKLFYPTIKAVDGLEFPVNEGEVEHDSIKRLIADLRKMNSGDEHFAARVKVLKEQVQHHVKEEESEIMPKVKGSELDLQQIGEEAEGLKRRIESRKAA